MRSTRLAERSEASNLIIIAVRSFGGGDGHFQFFVNFLGIDHAKKEKEGVIICRAGDL